MVAMIRILITRHPGGVVVIVGNLQIDSSAIVVEGPEVVGTVTVADVKVSGEVRVIDAPIGSHLLVIGAPPITRAVGCAPRAGIRYWVYHVALPCRQCRNRRAAGRRRRSE